MISKPRESPATHQGIDLLKMFTAGDLQLISDHISRTLADDCNVCLHHHGRGSSILLYPSPECSTRFLKHAPGAMVATPSNTT